RPRTHTDPQYTDPAPDIPADVTDAEHPDPAPKVPARLADAEHADPERACSTSGVATPSRVGSNPTPV
ncbi:hypothetical protein VR46_38555, partial [Streptomyces sp. NRRL S-444]